ncbi:MAG: transcription termination factor NusA [Bacilli bacterium]|nr:transcription termination factor NusA [Bacilli bacterium]
MDTAELKKAIDLLIREKNISEDYIYEALELALVSAYKKNYNSLPNVRVEFDRSTGAIHLYSFLTVRKEDEVDEDGDLIFDDRIDITKKEASKIVPGIEYGETIETEVTPKDFGRVAAATAKQVVIQKIREAEKNNIIAAFQDKQDEMVSGVVSMEDAYNYYIDLGKAQGLLPKTEIIPDEEIKMGSNIKVYITKVEEGIKGPSIILSRKHYNFVKRLFELEIPEITEGIIMVYSVAREAGIRTKIAVYSENNRVDPVGACIGEKGTRIAHILKELNGEKVDIVRYDKDMATFISNALSPAKDVHVMITDTKKQESIVIVNDDNFSLALGKKGLNVKLASKLTHYKIDIKTFEQAKEMGINLIA